MPDVLAYAFMQRALIAALLVGIAAPLVGVFIVQRRLALIGDGLGHVATTGVAIGLVTGQAPVYVALVVSVAAALLIELIRVKGKTSADLALAVMFYGGIAGGIVIVSQTEGGLATLNTYLFGAITTTTSADLAVFAVLAAVLVVTIAALRRELFMVSNDEEFARASGMPVTALNMLLITMVAVTVVLSMRVIGLLLISALMVLPVATAQLLARSFASTLAISAALGVAVSVSGVVGSFYWNTPSGGTIVLLAIAVFVAVGVFGVLRDRRRPRASIGDELALSSGAR